MDGRELKDQGVTNVLAAATAPHRVAFKEAASAIIDQYIAARQPFTADDIAHALESSTAPDPHSHNVLPALINTYARRRLITKVGYVESKRASRRCGIQRLWLATGA